MDSVAFTENAGDDEGGTYTETTTQYYIKLDNDTHASGRARETLAFTGNSIVEEARLSPTIGLHW